ncbi:MAG: hypothetical protein AAGM46_20585 [Cyanobacteria bacterium J06582_2]
MKQVKPNLLRLIILTIGAILLTWINLWSSTVAIAQTSLIPAPSVQEEQPTLLTGETTTLPDEVKTAVVNDAVKRTSKTVSAMRIVKASPQQWSDGCLGLGKPEEICIQAITPGWQVIVTDGIRNWIYRTVETGVVRLEQRVGS